MTARRRVFRLFANCVPVRGARRATLCDLQRQTYDLVPNGLLDVLERFAGHTLEEIHAELPPAQRGTLDEYLRFLVEREYGFWTDDPDAFPPLELAWERPELVTNALIDVDAGSRHDLPSLLRQLDELGCTALQVRFFRPVGLDEIEALLKMTHGGRLRSLELLVPWDAAWPEGALLRLCGLYQRVSGMMVHSAPEDRVEKVEHLQTPVFYRREVVTSHHHCGQVAPEWFNVTLQGFAEARHFNSCLNRKLSIDAAGDIRNCPSLPAAFGNAAQVPLVEALLTEGFRDLWGIGKDQVAVCRDCEFRYVCTDCRAFVADPADRLSKPARCSYDPYTARWGEPAPAAVDVSAATIARPEPAGAGA